MTSWIAEQPVVFVHADGRRVPGLIALGAPVQRELDCMCEVALEGLEPTRRIFGESTLQALLLGARELGMRLHDFGLRGGRVLDVSGDDAGLEAVFGPYLAPPRRV